MAADGGGFDWGAAVGPSTPAAPTAAPSGGGGGGFDWGAAGGGSSSPQVQQASVGSGAGKAAGGIFGFLGRAVHGAAKAVEGFPAGIAALGSDLGRVTYRAGENLVNDVTLGNTHFGPVSGWADRGGIVASPSQVAADVRTNYPTLEGIRAGYATTGREFAHPSQAVHNYLQDPTGSLLRDAGNIASVVAPVAGAAGALAEGADAAALANAAGTASRVGEVAGRVANLPQLPLQAAGALGRAVAEHIPTGTELTLADRLGSLQTRLAARTQAATSDIGGLQVPVNQETARIAGVADKVNAILAGNPDEMGAVSAIVRNETGGYLPPVEQAVNSGLLPREVAQRAREDVFTPIPGAKPEQQVGLTSADLAEKFALGVLPADQQARLTAAVEAVREGLLAPQQAVELAGTNRLPPANTVGPVGMPAPAGMNPEQLGNTPMRAAVAEKLAPLQTRLDKAQADAFKAQQAATVAAQRRGQPVDATPEGRVAATAQAKVASLQRSLNKARANWEAAPETAPAAWRPVLQRSQDFVNSLQIQADEFASRGDLATAGAIRRVAREIPTTLEGLTSAGVAQPSHMIGERLTAPGVVAGKPAPGPVTGIRTVGAQRQRIPENTLVATSPRQLAATYQRRAVEGIRNAHVRTFTEDHAITARTAGLDDLPPKQIVAEMAKSGRVPFNPALRFSRGIITDPAQVGADTPFVPKVLLQEMNRRTSTLFGRDEFGDSKTPAGVKAFDAITQAAYKTPLRFSPTFMTRKVASDLFMAHTEGDMSAADIVKYGQRAVHEMRSNDLNLAAGVRGSDLFSSSAEGRRPGVLGQAKAHVNNALSWVSDATKVAVALKQVAEGGKAPDAALTEAIRTMGDYQNRSAFERDIISRVFPVYPWAKTVGKAVAHYGEDHPIRTAWMLHLGDMAAQSSQQANLPNWLGGSVPLGNDRYLSARSLFPPLMLTGLGPGFTNPVLKFGAQAGLGLNPNTSKNWNLTQPGGSFGHDKTGRPPAASLPYLALKDSPLGSLYLRQTAPDVARYGTGQPILGKQGPTVYSPPPSLADRLRNFVGLPIQTYTAPPNAAKTQKANAKADAKYQQRLGKFGLQTRIPGLP